MTKLPSAGIINVHKESGITSFGVVSSVRRLLGVKRCGHTGTLDPMAEGVLPICFGYATKFADDVTSTTKEYEAGVVFGKFYDTYDITGKEIDVSPKSVTKSELLSVLLDMVGNNNLIVPAFSAKKINGVRAYSLARKGLIADAGTADMFIHSISLNSFDFPYANISIECSKGTYVRSLIHSIGLKLGTFAAMSSLIRTRVSCFKLARSYKLSNIKSMISESNFSFITPILQAISYGYIIIDDKGIENIKFGRLPLISSFLDQVNISDGKFLFVNKDKEPVAIASYNDNNIILQKVLIAP